VIPRVELRRILVVLLAGVVLAAAGVFWLHARRPARPSDLVAYLPAAGGGVISIDVDALRRSGLLDKVSGSKSGEDTDYQQFVRETKFDYRQDLDSVAAAWKDGRVYFALRGRFHWSDLKNYAARQSGSCHNDFCVVSGSQPNRRISFYPLRRDVLAMAVAPDDFAAYQVADHGVNYGKAIAPAQPSDPVWAIVPASALEQIDLLPTAAKGFVPALKGADQIVLSIGTNRDRQLQLGVRVTCKDSAAASALLAQLEAITKALGDLVARQKQKPDASDFTGILVAGSFRSDNRLVYGSWPIPPAFVDAIAGTVY
jgi:hypothetical protein